MERKISEVEKTPGTYEKKHNYKPSFRWKDDTIYDHDRPIAYLSYTCGCDHIRLVDMRLKPGGEPLIRWNLSWRRSYFYSANELVDLKVHTPQRDKFSFSFTATTSDKMFRAQTQIILSYDQKRGCYRYDADSTLFMDHFPFWTWKQVSDWAGCDDQVPSEYANIAPINAWKYPSDKRAKKWQSFVYRNPEGKWMRVPQHPVITPDKYHISFSSRYSPTMGFVNEISGNPCVELLDQTASNTRASLCHAGHDVHLDIMYGGFPRQHHARYAIYLFTPEETEEILAQAQLRWRYTEEEKKLYDFPRFEGEVCDFEKGHNLDKEDINIPFWLPQGEIRYTEWNSNEGRNGSRCLKTQSPTHTLVAWWLESPHAPPVEPGKRYLVTAFVKTNALVGEGAFLEVWTQSHPGAISRSEKVSGTTQWHKLEASIELSQSDSSINMRLVHKGRGTSWFDDVAVAKLEKKER